MTTVQQTGSIDLGANNTAAKTATNYIAVDSTGIRIANTNPSTATTYQHQTATETEFVVDGESRAEIGGSGVRLGKEYVQNATNNESHMELDYHSLQMADKEGETYLHVSDLRLNNGMYTAAEVLPIKNNDRITHNTTVTTGIHPIENIVSVSYVQSGQTVDDTSN